MCPGKHTAPVHGLLSYPRIETLAVSTEDIEAALLRDQGWGEKSKILIGLSTLDVDALNSRFDEGVANAHTGGVLDGFEFAQPTPLD